MAGLDPTGENSSRPKRGPGRRYGWPWAQPAFLPCFYLLSVLLLAGCAGVVTSPTLATLPSSATRPIATMAPTPTLALLPSENPVPTPRSSPTFAHGPVGFTASGDMSSGRAGDTATLLHDGRVLIVGGTDVWGGGTQYLLGTADLYDPATGKFTATGPLSTARHLHVAALLPDGRVLIAGGVGECVANPCPTIAAAEVYDPATGVFSTTGALPDKFFAQSATTLSDGKVLIIGVFNGGSPAETAAAQLFDPATGAFKATGSLPTVRAWATVNPLPDGRVLVSGGYSPIWANGLMSGEMALASAEIYDPAASAFSPTGSLKTARIGAAAALLADGRILVVGGCRGYIATTSITADQFWVRPAEIYDPRTGKFSVTGSTGVPSRGCDGEFTATLLLDGRVLIAGGDNNSGQPRTADLYDPKTGKFSATKALATQRRQHTATLLVDGRVLIAGGIVAGAPVTLSSAELYQP
jgi:hypothetical protein